MEPQAPSFVMRVPLDRVTGLAMDAGVRFALRGTVTAALDGASFDASRLFDFAAGGLHVVDGAPAQAAYVLAATGETAAACVAAGAPSPCLVPRLAELAHERLHTAGELAATLSGSIELESLSAGAATTDHAGAIGGVALALGLAGLAWAAVAFLRRLGRDSMWRVRMASRRALLATRGDSTLEPVRPRIVALVDRARHLDAVRRACARKLRRVDRAALDRQAGALALASGASASSALATLSVERDEIAHLEREVAAATTEIDRIASALRAVALRVCSRDALAGGVGGADPVDALASELDFREQALAEANAR
jgi:hypothetical protein